MRHVQILAHKDVREEVFRRLRDLEIMEVSWTDELPDGVVTEEKRDKVNDYSEELSKLGFIRSYLERYNRIEKNFIEMFTGNKPEIADREFTELISSFDLDGTFEKVQSNDVRLKEIDQDTSEISSRIETLKPWSNIDVPFNHLEGTAYTESVLASFSVANWEANYGELEDKPVFYEIVSQDVSSVRVLIMAFKKGDFDLHRWVLDHSGTIESFSDLVSQEQRNMTPSELINALETRLSQIAEEKDAIQKEDAKLAQSLVHVLGMVDYYLDKRNLEELEADAPKTRYTLVIDGWVRARDVDRLKSALEDINELSVSDWDPEPQDNVPVYLENHPLIRPFEVVTNIFGYPQYNEIDPTPVLAPFFWAFFGMTLGDAVYGLALFFGSMIFLKTQRLAEGGQKLVRLIMYCGISTVIYGALTGSWMADLTSVFMPGSAIDQLVSKFAIVDPVGDPLTVLVISLAFGIFHVWVGLCVKFYGLLKQGEIAEAVFSQLSWIIFLPGLITWALTKIGVLQSEIPFYVMIVGAILVMYGSSRDQKNILLKPFSGLYGLYGTINYFSDTMSYARLLALGLASAIIGVVVNKMAELVVNMIPVVGWALVPIILIGGHIFNLVINALGSFIHSGRLQFVEFFTKFFEGGGKPFRPLTRVSENVFVNKT
jgi:V/A-type H+-transporting ATPase subunit I